MKLKLISLLIGLIFMPIHLLAQASMLYTPEEHISSSLINYVYQDKKGFIWIATEYGLNQFDGNQFISFKHNKSDSNSLCNNYVRTIFEDSRNTLWVGTMTGLMIYNRDTDSFTPIHLYREGNLVKPHVTQIIERSNGEIWIATSNEGIFKIDLTQKCGQYTPNTYKKNLINITSIIEDDNGLLWLGSEFEGLSTYNPQNGEVKPISPISENNITSLAKDEEGNIYIATFTKGLNIYNKKTGEIEYISSQESFHIKDITLIGKRLYIGTDGKGIKFYNKNENKIQDLYIDESLIDLTDAKVHSIINDKDGNLWLGLFQKGVLFIPGKKNPFLYYGNKLLSKSPIGKGCVMSIHQDSRNHMFVGVDNEGLYELTSDFVLIKHHAPKEGKNSFPETILSIFEDSDKQLWLGSYARGITRFNPSTGTCNYIPELTNERVFSIVEDKQRNLYISTYGSGFYTYNLDTRQLTNYRSSEGMGNPRNEVADNWINCIYCDSEGLIWIGHFKGISCFNPKTKSFINFTPNNYIINNSIGYSIIESLNHTIWMGTTNGLYSLNKQTKKIQRYTAADGLDNEVICGIREDKTGGIWVSTFNGISKFIPEKKSFTNYYASDGLQGSEFTRGAVFQSPCGRIFFGGTNGITCFTPEDITNATTEADIQITDFQISGQSVNKNTLSGGKPILSKAITEATDIRLSYQDNTFRISFSTMQYDHTRQTYYQYRIRELDKDWLSTPLGSNYVTYNNLRPGRYTFEVRAVTRNHLSEIRTLHITITPPWYQSWWAYLIYSLLSIALLFNLINYIRIRMRRRRDMLELKHAEELNEAKLQFFINISHEIRTPMTLIINPLEKLIANCQDPEQNKIYLMIYRNGQRILRLINQMMDIRKIEKGQMRLSFRETDMVEFINDLMLTFEHTAQQKHIKFSFIHSNPEVKAWVDLNNFDKILMNLLSNAFKYTPDGETITVILTTGEDKQAKTALRHYIEIKVTDSGIGLDEAQKDFIFERFYQINNGITHNQGGTGVGLHLTRSLVELHHGTITADNNPGSNGSTFTVRIPSGCDHLSMEEIEAGRKNEQHISLNSDSPIKKETVVLPQTEEEPKKKRAKNNLTLLIVDDEKEIQDYLKQELANEYKIATCNDGKEAYEYLLNHEIDLVVSDVMMDNMDGMTLCKKIKQNANTNHIPVILLTARDRVEDQVEGLDTGADAYIVKPFNTEILKSRIASLLTNRRILKNKFSGIQQQSGKIQKITLKSADEALLDKIMKIINENLSETNLNVEMLAEAVGLSRVHLHRKLKELTNLSTRDFIKNIRMQQASELLKEKKLTISEVAYAVGYNSLSHFSSSFKDTYGVTPTEYMQSNLAKDDTEANKNTPQEADDKKRPEANGD